MTTIIHLLPEIDKSVWKKGGTAKKKRLAGKSHHNNAKIPDETILAMRRMYEIEGKPMRAVAAAFPEVSECYVKSILLYVCRINLRVRP